MMSLITRLKEHVVATPNKLIYSFLDTDEPVNLTYKEMDQQARAIAAELIQLGACAGDRVLIALPQSVNYLTSFWACLYAKLIAVPVFPLLTISHANRTLGIIKDAEARFVIANQPTIEILRSNYTFAHEIFYIDAETLSKEDRGVTFVEPDLDTIAFLQYTSGSTGNPKGVIVKHRNLMANLHMLQMAIDMDADTRLVSWLPLFHDMGLIGNALQAAYLGAQLHFMSPSKFIKKPLFWLEMITKYQATHIFAPSFAYEMCLAEAHKANGEKLNLSSVRRVINGAEPVRVHIMESFADAFEPYGLDPTTLTAGYGMAEATLYITRGNASRQGLECEELDENSLRVGQSVLADSYSSAVRRVANHGKYTVNQELTIVDPTSLCTLPTRTVGEIWVKGPHICAGYWNKSELNKETFSAYTKNTQTGPWLRTGDLGYLNENGELFIIGRCKDVIIIHGKNFAPQDIEHTVEDCSDLFKPNSVIAIAAEDQQKEKLVVIAEIRNKITSDQAAELRRTIKKHLLSDYSLAVHEIVFVGRGGIPKTTSGKLQRQICRQNYLSKQLPILQVSAEAPALLVQ